MEWCLYLLVPHTFADAIGHTLVDIQLAEYYLS